MGSFLPIVLFALGGVLVGGAYSMRSQGAPKPLVVAMVVAAVLSVAGGVLWLIPK